MCDGNNCSLQKLLHIKVGGVNLSKVVIAYIVGYVIGGADMAKILSVHMALAQVLDNYID